MSAAARRSILVGQKIVGGAALAASKIFFKDSLQNSGLSSKFSDDPFLVIENCCNKITTQQQWHRRRADKLSAAAVDVDGPGCAGPGCAMSAAV